MRQYPSTGLEETFAFCRRSIRDPISIFLAEVAVYQGVPEINQRRQEQGYQEFVDIIRDADSDNLPAREDAGKGDIKYNETIDELRHQR